MSPEITRKLEYDGKPVDVWALGVVLYVMVTGTPPFKGTNEQDLFKKIQKGIYRTSQDVFLQSKEIKTLISLLLHTDSKKRMTAEELIECSFVRCDDLHLNVFELAPTLMRKALA